MVQFALLYAFLKTRKETKKREREDGRGWVARGLRRETIGGIIEKRGRRRGKRSGRGQGKKEVGEGRERGKREGAGKERRGSRRGKREEGVGGEREKRERAGKQRNCLLYTSDAADDC